MKKPVIHTLLILFLGASFLTVSSCRDEEKTTEDKIEQVGDDIEEGVEEVGDEIDDHTDDN
ncbi:MULTISPECIES: hypothetical protein [Cellulophaga]|jgi:hypothetical protein|uniref:Uncharacterized protein n=1 Tax=Cellulophaga baltica TaxID=76594 RepID=A0A1G7DEC4_9FLAO|nr:MULTISPECIES: hypothetical protein [Cellulophaga]WFO14772.1 hypothetical protein M601_012560 [Cellulophaga baltica 4]AIY12883.1 membrane protein [Cellulophaga baltica NN016038]KGK32118.1 membrane protein [Cellulophaga sp. E6(2014)]MBA6313583.1 hypothetical protein [Cellulophaga baltica]MCR1023444.1 hypothetical protein [Cellulophaga baltica]